MSRKKRVRPAAEPALRFNSPTKDEMLAFIGKLVAERGYANPDTHQCDLAGVGVVDVLARYPDLEPIGDPVWEPMQFAPKLRSPRKEGS